MHKYHLLSIISVTVTCSALILLTPFSDSAAEGTQTPSLASTNATSTPSPKDAYFLPTVQKLIVSNDNCRLPCFLNLTPGKTAEGEIQQFVRDNFNGKDLGTARVVNDKDYFYLALELVTSDEPSLAVEFMAEHNLLSLMTVDMDIPFKWLPENILDLPHLLLQIDATPNIYLAISLGTKRFFIVIAFNDIGMMAEYTFDFEDDQFLPFTSQPIQICPSEEQNTSITLWLQSPTDKLRVEDRIYSTQPPGKIKNDSFLRPADKVLRINTSDFIQWIKSNPNSCIEARSFNELSEQGQTF